VAGLSDLIYAHLEPEVSRIREEFFGKPGPPFESLAAAAEWIESEAEKREVRETTQGGSQRRLQDLHSLREKIADHYGFETEPEGILLLEFCGPESAAVRKVAIPRGSELLKLKHFAKRASRQTGLGEPRIVTFVLTGVKMLASRLTVGTTSGPIAVGTGSSPFPRLKEVTIKIRGHHVTRKDFLRAFDALQVARSRIPIGRTAVSIRESTVALVRAAHRMGGVPKGRVPKAFWEAVADSKEARPYKKVSAEGVRKRFERLRGRDDNLSQTLTRMLFETETEE
jgi:hypothetical protein